VAEPTWDSDVLVIGASAAGLAVASQLHRHRIAFELLESRDMVAGAWRGHYDRLHLHTPRSSSALPGLAMPRSWGRYPSRDQVVQYLDGYRRRFELDPRFGQPVTRLARVTGGWQATTPQRTWRAPRVVVATGRTRVPVRPTWPGMGEFSGEVLHSSEYRNGEPWRGGTVLVVGFGNSACEQALDLAEHGVHAHLAVRSPVNIVPRDVLGLVPVLQLGIVMRTLPPSVADAMAAPMIMATVGDVRRLGLRKLPYGPNTQIARDHHIPLLDIGTVARIRSGEIGVHPGIERFTSTGVVFDDATTLDVDAVVLGTGYRAGVEEFLEDAATVCDDDGNPLTSGTETLPGLYFCGMHVSPAGMLREMGIEARRIATDMATHPATVRDS
jgi:indole-3-pyruvate monooxygenase